MEKSAENSQNLSLHIFCDASKVAYTACIFLRNESENSTSRLLDQDWLTVSPMKTITIPWLEPLACTIS